MPRIADATNTDKVVEYKTAGFNAIMLGSDTALDENATWEGSNAQLGFNKAVEQGFDKIIVRDLKINNYVWYSYEALLAMGNSLKESVKSRLSHYVNEPEFYGIVLGDEPVFSKAKTYGLIYKTIKQASRELGKDDIYIHMNLLPVTSGGFSPTPPQFQEFDADGVTSLSYRDSYKKYLTDFIISAEADALSVDIYIFRGSEAKIYDGSYACMQIFADVCKKYSVTPTFCLQSYGANYGNGTVNYAVVDQDMMRMELYSLMGLGVEKFAYFTYNQGGEAIDGSAFINADGSKSEIYSAGKELMVEARAFEKVILNYEYQGCNVFVKDTPTYATTVQALKGSIVKTDMTYEYLDFDTSYKFVKLKGLTCDNDIAFVTELKDSENGLYMYMVQNVIDPRNIGDLTENVTVFFDATYTGFAVYRNGVRSFVDTDNGSYSFSLNAGEAVFIVPFC